MESEPAVVEISSDDEDLCLEKLDLDWVAELLDLADGGAEDVDDVMVVDEFSVTPAKPTLNSESWRADRGAADDESDDDCLVLDSDPDNPVSVVDDKGGGGDGSDDLLILGEKGQWACRDYAHPRHLCANFPFSTTSHEKHCKLCHCYVCDSPAPCSYWGNGSASIDHCHSTDKDGRWRALRQSFKQKNTSSQPQKLPDTALSMLPSFQNSVPLRRSNTSSLSIPSSRSNPLRPCLATRCATPDPANRIHHQNSAPLSYLGGQRPGHYASKSHALNPRTQCVQRQNRVAGALTPQLVCSQTRFKRVGTARSGPVSLNENQSPCSALNNNQLQRNAPQRYHFTPVTSRRTQCPPATSERSQRPPVTLPQSPHSAPVTSQISQCPPVTSVDDSMNQMYRTAPQKSQCVPVRPQSSQCPMMTLVNDKKSWQEILASMASELGVSDSNSGDAAPDVQQPLMVSSQPQPFSQFVSETNASQDVDVCGHSAPEVTNLNSLDFDCGWVNPAAQSIPENAQGVDSQLKDVQPSDSLVSGCNQDPGDSRLGSILAFIGEELVAESAKEPGQLELVPPTLLYDFEPPWSSLPPV